MDLCALLYNLSLDGGPDEECGSSSEGAGWLGLMVGVEKDSLADVAKEDGIPPEALDKDFAEMKGKDGKIHATLFERTEGFVDCNYYDSAKEARKVYEKLCAELDPQDSDE